MKNMLWKQNWQKSRLPGGCTPVVYGGDIALHDGAGAGLGEFTDEVGYFETEINGDFSLSAKLLESERAYYGTAISTGIMARGGVAGNDTALYFGLASDGLYHVFVRPAAGGSLREIPVEDVSQTDHRYIRLERRGEMFICSVSADGADFTPLASVAFGAKETLHVGFTSAFKSVYGGVTLFLPDGAD